MVRLQSEPFFQLVRTWIFRFVSSRHCDGISLTIVITDADLKNFIWDLGKEGFVLQLISLAGLHSNATATGQ